MGLTTPVVFVVFNRPETTMASFARIRAQEPEKLFLIADGPRDNVTSDARRCEDVRGIVGMIDWPCEVHRDFAESNLGLKRRVVSGLDWVFSSVPEAIVLEDDCVAHDDFFSFCSSMLDRYRSDDRVAVVTGNNFQEGRWRGAASYYFSKYSHCWGWATWADSWKRNDPELSFWPEWRRSEGFRLIHPDSVERRYWREILDRTWSGRISTWDYQWTASVWRHHGLTVTPNVNLVANIGFGPDATHTAEGSSPAQMSSALGTIVHADKVVADREADRFTFDHHYGGTDLRGIHGLRRLAGRARHALGSRPGTP